MTDKPKLRPIEAFPVEVASKSMIALRDPAQIATETILVSEDLLYLLQYFDGNHTQAEIQAAYSQQFGLSLPAEHLNQIISDLDKHFFLTSSNYQNHLAQLFREYREMPTRPAALAGQSYAADPEILRSELGKHFEAINGKNTSSSNRPARHAKALILPHIDIKAGGVTFAYGYDQLLKSKPVDLFIILGTGHSGILNAFACSDKDFQTPLGTVNTDKTFLAELQDRISFDIFSEELLHKSEHTIEFQTIFLQYLFGARPDWKIIPILCSFNTAMLQHHFYGRLIENFILALKEIIRHSSQKICVIASADLAHVGQKYGDQFSPDQKFLNTIRNNDQQSLAYAGQLDIPGFTDSIRQDENERRICGFPPIYAMLNIIEATEGHLLHYDQVAVDHLNSTVSFASMAFY